MANKKEIEIISKLSKTQLTKEEVKFLNEFLGQCFHYLSEHQRKLSADISYKIGLMKDFSEGK